jgi:predicted O-methyltransferase YrrM
VETDLIGRAVRLPGDTRRVELEWLAEQAAKHQRIVEIGAYVGRSTLALAATPGIVVTVDDWFGPRDVKIAKEHRPKLWDEFHANTEDLIDAGKIKPIVMDHADLWQLSFPMGLPDMVFIDGDHRPRGVTRDVLNAVEWLKDKGGLLCGHDFELVGHTLQPLFRDPLGRGPDSLWYMEFVVTWGAVRHG